VDRKKDMLIVSGFNVYPTNVEQVLIQHPKLMEVAVAGIQDPYRGETVKAWVVLKPGQTATEEEIVEWAKNSGQLAAYERPRVVEFRNELPKTLVGKCCGGNWSGRGKKAERLTRRWNGPVLVHTASSHSLRPWRQHKESPATEAGLLSSLLQPLCASRWRWTGWAVQHG
jgi:hypothetical protein